MPVALLGIAGASNQINMRRTPYITLGLLNIATVVALALVVSRGSMAEVGPVDPITPVPALASRSSKSLRTPKSGVPVHVEVLGTPINIAVDVGSYRPKSASWTVGSGAAFYADTTVPANNSNGTTLIYGHDTADVFGALPYISKQAIARVRTDSGLTFSYKYQSSRQVMPDDTSMLTDQGPPVLILQTCSGMFDSYRTLVTFRLFGVMGYE